MIKFSLKTQKLSFLFYILLEVANSRVMSLMSYKVIMLIKESSNLCKMLHLLYLMDAQNLLIYATKFKH